MTYQAWQRQVLIPNCSACQDVLEKHLKIWQYINRGIIFLLCWNSSTAVTKVSDYSHSVGSQQSRVCCWRAEFKAPLVLLGCKVLQLHWGCPSGPLLILCNLGKIGVWTSQSFFVCCVVCFWSPNVKQHRLGKGAVRSSVLTSRLFWLWEPTISLGHFSAVCAGGAAVGLGWQSDQAVKRSKELWSSGFVALQEPMLSSYQVWVSLWCSQQFQSWKCKWHLQRKQHWVPAAAAQEAHTVLWAAQKHRLQHPPDLQGSLRLVLPQGPFSFEFRPAGSHLPSFACC